MPNRGPCSRLPRAHVNKLLERIFKAHECKEGSITMAGGQEDVAEERMPSSGWLSCSSWTKCGHLLQLTSYSFQLGRLQLG